MKTDELLNCKVMENIEKELTEILSISFSDAAKGKILEALNGQEEKTALRLEAKAQGGPEFSYAMRLIQEGEKTAEDFVIDAGGFEVVADPDSARNLEGASVDFEERAVRSGFKFSNPNKPKAAELGNGPRNDLEGTVEEKVRNLVDSELNPAVASHGGRINLHGVKDNKVYLSFGGGCHGCGMVNVTLKNGVEARIKELIPEIEEVIDTTDHSSGMNPFYS
jgi:Fe/S biogenesis protein NfuA